MITATQVGIGEHPNGTFHVYELSKSVSWGYRHKTGKPIGKTKFVVVSAAMVPFSGPEVFIFPSDEDGKILDWMELDGSLKGTMIHEDAIANAGWKVK